MAGVNKVILIGNLGKDPELRRIPSGTSVATFSLATTERWNDKSGLKQDHTEWHNIVAWGKLADLAHQYLKKGRSVYIEGKITTRSWDDKDGNKRYRTEIVANQIQFIGSGAGATPSTPAIAGADFTENAPPDYASLCMGMSDAGSQGQSAPIEDDLPF
ncbi:MAG: single-stranded DNA-binding protein [Chitinivibrionales bacterium]|nr:single-stranded DNA-binding protein [Chitinivibrionales bacterium]